MGFVCSVCGEYHEELMLDIRAGLPEPVFQLSDAEREERAEVSDDWCVFRDLDGVEHFYVRSLVEIPIPSLDDQFAYGVWVEVTPQTFARLGDLWHDERGPEEPAFPATLANELAPYEDTLGLPVMVQLREVERLPSAELVETDHLLRDEQSNGITEARAQELAATVLH